MPQHEPRKQAKLSDDSTAQHEPHKQSNESQGNMATVQHPSHAVGQAQVVIKPLQDVPQNSRHVSLPQSGELSPHL